MKAQALVQLARFMPLFTWSGTATATAIAVSIATVGLAGINWMLALVSIVVVFAFQYVAHPINDIVDYTVDVRANIDGTGRRKVLISGLANVTELRILSGGIILGGLALMLWISSFLPFAGWFAFAGLLAVWAYNADPFRLSYYPFSEVLISAPTGICVVVGTAYIATGLYTPLFLVAGLVVGLSMTAMHASYFAMDYQSDFVGGKNSTIVTFPGVRWTSLYAFTGLVVSAVVTAWGLAHAGSIYVLFALPMALFVALFLKATNIDTLWQGYEKTHGQAFKAAIETAAAKGQGLPELPEPAARAWATASTAMRTNLVHQMILIIGHGVLFAAAIVVWAVI